MPERCSSSWSQSASSSPAGSSWGVCANLRGEAPAPSLRHPAVIAVGAVVAVLLAGALLAGVSTGRVRSPESWTTAQGINEHAGFLGGCRASTGGRVDCECIFARLVSTPPYDTPSGFGALAGALDRYQQTGNRADVPAAYIQAIEGCRTGA